MAKFSVQSVTMDIVNKLTDSELVAKFQRACGVERLPDHCDTDEIDVDSLDNEEVCYDKYVKHRHTDKYVLKQNIKTQEVTRSNFEKEGVPPFASEDSDSDNGHPKGHGRFKITPHRINNVFLYYVFRIASFFGDEAFYLTFFPFLVWNIDAYISRHAIVIWCICMYFGQVTKDIFQWPRPAAPPVVRLETDFAQEFSMPSTHAVAGSSIPMALGYAILNRYEVSPVLVWSVVVIWCVLVCLSRLYLGVHTPLDLMAGIGYTLAVSIVVLPFIEQIDWFVQTHPLAPAVLFLLCFYLSIVYYPAPFMGNTTRGDSIQVIACVTGCFLGFWCNYFNDMSYVVEKDGLYPLSPITLNFLMTSIFRFLVGGIIVLLVKMAVKAVSVKGVSYVLGLAKPDKRHPKVEIWYKFITYMTLGVIITWTVPILLTKFGLARNNFYAEVL